MAADVLIFGTDDLFPQLQPLYAQAEHLGLIKIVGYANFENNGGGGGND